MDPGGTDSYGGLGCSSCTVEGNGTFVVADAVRSGVALWALGESSGLGGCESHAPGMAWGICDDAVFENALIYMLSAYS